MIREEGYIIYTNNNDPTPITENVIQVSDPADMGITYTITTDVPHIFQYDYFLKKWYIKDLSIIDDDVYNRFEGTVLDFRYGLQFVPEAKMIAE